NDNRSCNYGAEGPTDDEGINAIREQQKRNFLTTLLFSHGTPMYDASCSRLEFGQLLRRLTQLKMLRSADLLFVSTLLSYSFTKA
ncbi:hypothetical protein MJI47_29070, partial [Salmonella enterica subsp. enterica serovar Kentucky]|nr:hypothetical protein [Salmonella enterica subsp. enterica serovar Kentucky]